MTETRIGPVVFYYPGWTGADAIPEAGESFVSGRAGQYIWTVKTCGLLQRHGMDCVLSGSLPDSGIIITHRDFLSDDWQPNPRQLMVCVVADCQRHPYAQLHLLQNQSDPMLTHPDPLWPAVYMPHWTETGLLARNPARADAMINVTYFGLPERLAPQLRDAGFACRLQDEGFKFRIADAANWNDYSDTDAVLAVRSFADVPFYRHPPTKLFNCWLAGVPGLLGAESAYRAERRSELDYFEVGSTDAILAALRQLRDVPGLRKAIEANSASRAAEISHAALAGNWFRFCEQQAAGALAQWCALDPMRRRQFFAARKPAYLLTQVKDFAYRSVLLLRKKLAEVRR